MISYSSSFDKAIQILTQRKNAARTENENLKKELYSRIPSLLKIDQALAMTGSNIAKAILDKNTDTKQKIRELEQENLALQQKRRAILSSAGLAEDILEIKYHCSICNDEGFVNFEKCECLKKLIKEDICQSLNSSSYLKLSDFDSFVLDYYPDSIDERVGLSPREIMTKHFNYCKSYAEGFSLNSPNLLFRGATGLGKTHLSLSIAKTVIEKGFNVLYGSTPNFVHLLEKEKFSKSENDTLTAIIECDLLILDDLGAEFTTQFVVSSVYYIIETRLSNQKPTIISTNFSIQELLEKYTERVVSRIIGEYIPLNFLGRDIRQLKNK